MLILHFSEMGTFLHPCENEMVYKSVNEKVPKFNSMVYTQTKQEIGKIDEIFGPINEVVGLHPDLVTFLVFILISPFPALPKIRCLP